MENRMADKTVTTCTSVLIALFQKRRQSQKLPSDMCNCSCLCHTYEKNTKGLSNLDELNDNKFFNCKCNHECQEYGSGRKRTKKKIKRKKKKKIVKFQIEHTGSMNSLVSPVKNRTNQLCICDKIRNTSSLCKFLQHEKLNEETATSPSHHVGCFFYQRSPSLRPIKTSRTYYSKKYIRPNVREQGRCVGYPIDTSCEQDDSRPKSLCEWSIPFEDIEFGKVEAVSPQGPVYRGRWHGDVMIYSRSHETQEEIDNFYAEVSLFGLIRHENVVLFMGACFEAPNMAIVTSLRKGHTLYTHLHLRDSSFHFGSKLSIAKQIAQGMGYLHAKGIALGKLCSRNIFLESKVKISITDYTVSCAPKIKEQYGCVPKGYLTYLAPELIRSLCKTRSIYLSCLERATEKADIYAYGTILYELFVGWYPFYGSQPEHVIWKISNGYSQTLEEGQFPKVFKTLVESCWSQQPEKRPDFQEVLTNMRKMNIPRSLQKKLSLSDSGAINKEQQMIGISRLTASPAQQLRWKIYCSPTKATHILPK